MTFDTNLKSHQLNLIEPVDFSEDLANEMCGEVLAAFGEAENGYATLGEIADTIEAKGGMPTITAFHKRADAMRPLFGCRDIADPASRALLNLVAAQNSITMLIEAEVECGDDIKVEIEAALEARRQAAADLCQALEICPRAYQ